MGEPLFCLELLSRNDLRGDAWTDVLRKEFESRGYALSEGVSVHSVGNEDLIIDDDPKNDSYVLREAGDKLAAYPAYVKLGREGELESVTADELHGALGGTVTLVHLERCLIPDEVRITNGGLTQDSDGRFVIDKEIVCRDCVFQELVDFSDTTFLGEIDLRGSAFRKGGDFRGTTYHENSNFDLTEFSEFAHFVRATFQRGAHFSGASFEGDALFYRTVFRGSAGFTRASFQQRVDFTEAAFWGGTAFTESTFLADADFSRAQFVGRVDFSGAHLSRPAGCTDVRYWPNTIAHWWRRKLLYDWTYRVTWRTTDGDEEPLWLTRKLLPSDSYPSGPPKEATEFYIESEYISEVSSPLFKRYVADMQFIRAFRDENPHIGWLWQWSADYGRSLSVWVFWSAVVVIFFALCFTPADASVPLVDWQMPWWWRDFWLERGPRFDQTAGKFAGDPLDFWSSVYFSVVTFTTLGFGDIAPSNGPARIVTTAEVILGYIMLGGLISILAHKLARRS